MSPIQYLFWNLYLVAKGYSISSNLLIETNPAKQSFAIKWFPNIDTIARTENSSDLIKFYVLANYKCNSFNAGRQCRKKGLPGDIK